MVFESQNSDVRQLIDFVLAGWGVLNSEQRNKNFNLRISADLKLSGPWKKNISKQPCTSHHNWVNSFPFMFHSHKPWFTNGWRFSAAGLCMDCSSFQGKAVCWIIFLGSFLCFLFLERDQAVRDHSSQSATTRPQAHALLICPSACWCAQSLVVSSKPVVTLYIECNHNLHDLSSLLTTFLYLWSGATDVHFQHDTCWHKSTWAQSHVSLSTKIISKL